MIDSHAHLDMDAFDADREEVLRRARAAGVRAILCPIDIASPKSLGVVTALLRQEPGLRAAAGLHPHQASEWTPELADSIRGLAAAGTISAVGEIGLDYHYNLSPRERQKSVFAEQLALARSLRLPVLIHSREAAPDILAAVDAAALDRGGILHCFTEDGPFAEKMIGRGFWISFAGIATFPAAGALREVARRIPLERLLVETDSPYLAPVPHRGSGKRNEPAFVVETARLIAGLRGLSYAEFEAAVEANFEAFLRSALPV